MRLLLTAHKLPPAEYEYRFHPKRRWRWDVAFVSRKLAVEIDGGLYVRGRHSRGAGRERDMEKIAEGMILGWRVLCVSHRHLRTGQAMEWLRRLLEVW